MGQVDCVHCRHRLVYEKQRSWGQACMSSHQLGTEAGGTISGGGNQCKSQLHPQLHRYIPECQLCNLAPAQKELRTKYLGTSLTHGAAVIMHPYCYKVLVETVVIKGGGTQLSLGVKKFDRRCGPPHQQVHLG